MSTDTDTDAVMRTRTSTGMGTDTGGGAGPRTLTTARGRLGALGRAEFTLLRRNRAALFSALFLPFAMIGTIKMSLSSVDLGGTGITAVEAAMTGGVGTALIFVVYANLVGVLTTRRETLVLKRLRVGEASDREILIGTALPAGALVLLQSAVMVAAGVGFLGLSAPRRPDILILGMVLGIVLLTALAAATTSFTRSAESAQITTLPLFLISAIGSGMFVPLDVLPDRIADICRLLPTTGMMTLVRAGWLGGVGGYELLRAALNALVWILIGAFAVRRWFRWEPRR
jgi:ABC-2 type transport system permease protein